MTEKDHETDVGIEPWVLFEKRLFAYLSTMIDPGDGDVLTLHVPVSTDETSPIVTIKTTGNGSGVKVDYPFDVTGCDFDGIADMAWRICHTLQSRYKLMHPAIMTASADGSASRGLAILGLTEDMARPFGEHPPPPPAAREALYPPGRVELCELVLEHLQIRFGSGLEVDDQDLFKLNSEGVEVWVRVTMGTPPMICLFADTFLIVDSRPADAELNELKRDFAWSRWVRRGRTIRQELALPGYPFVPSVLDEMLVLFVSNNEAARHDFADRIHGRSAT